jgi:uncharacterized iron-regulated membrane protein
MGEHLQHSGGRPAGHWVRWVGTLVALCAVAFMAVALMWGRPGAEAQSVGERQQLVQWERRRTEALEKQARAAEQQARAADRQTRALEDMARRLASIERVCGR